MSSRCARDVLGYRVAFRSADPMVEDYLHRLYGAFAEVEEHDREYEFRPYEDRYALFGDGEVIGHADGPEGLMGTLVHSVNREVATSSDHVLIHAGGLERNGVGIALPAHMESGKTTLTAGLVRAGFGYLTDEAVAIDRTTVTVTPYPKPLSIDQGAWPLFPELEPDEPFATDAYKDTQWQVPPTAIRPDALGRECAVRFVVFPEYREGSTTELIPMTRAEGLVELTRNTFRFDQQGRPTLDVLTEMIRDVDVFRLPNGSLDEAIACVSGLVD